MLGFGVFLLIIGIICLVLNPGLGLFLLLLAALFMGFGAIAKNTRPADTPLSPKEQEKRDHQVAFATGRTYKAVRDERIAREGANRRPCPMCAEAILPAAKICPHCKSTLSDGWSAEPAK